MKYHSKDFRNNIILIFFVLFVCLTVYIGHALKVETVKQKDETIFSRLTSSDFENLERIKITNKQGDFVLEKSTINLNTDWRYKSPLNFRANLDIITNIKVLFDKMKLKTKLEENPVNLTNFFPAQTKSKIILSFPEKEVTILVGLQNSIDKSLYIKLENEAGIYQVESPSINIDTLTSKNFINSKPFLYNAEKITSLSITTKMKKRDIVFLDGNFKEENILLDTEMITNNLRELNSLETEQLIEVISDEQKKSLAKYIELKENTTELKIIDDLKSYQYLIINSPTLFPVPDLKLKEMILIYAQDIETIYFFPKEQFKLTI